MGCRISRWQERKQKRGERCRVLVCGGRKIIECVSHEWWKQLPLPKARLSDVCGKGCTEEEIVVQADVGPPVGQTASRRRGRRRR